MLITSAAHPLNLIVPIPEQFGCAAPVSPSSPPWLTRDIDAVSLKLLKTNAQAVQPMLPTAIGWVAHARGVLDPPRGRS